ncbi:hypothetical protein Ahy_A05g023938 [Arachis hypogaea]|uniref:Putative plant transposon protein domain-containing protein n=1 Tax=Arachis hypogaea TaxID=3818 RepID=A0A445D510_ARAHY|nr:hypothetical protein Ahy_A05g023938 [Arachis hypogaea]
MPRNGKEKANPLARPSPAPSSTQPETFINETAKEQYKKLEKKAFNYKGKLNLPEKYTDQILDRLNFYQWKFIGFNPMEINEHQVKEFYENLLKRDTPTILLRGVTLDTSNHALEALLQIPHIPLARDAYTQIVKDLTSGKLSLDVVLKRIGQPEAEWEYNKGENAVPLSIPCSELTLEARIWQQIIADYILPSTHGTHIRVCMAMLLCAILEGKRISVLPIIRDSMWKVNQQQKYSIPFPSMITRLATLSGVERRPIDRTSVFISK